jgi:hypothetical protein
MLWVLAFYEILPAERIDKPPIASGVKTACGLANDDLETIPSIVMVLTHFYLPLYLLQCAPERSFGQLVQVQ